MDQELTIVGFLPQVELWLDVQGVGTRCALVAISGELEGNCVQVG